MVSLNFEQIKSEAKSEVRKHIWGRMTWVRIVAVEMGSLEGKSHPKKTLNLKGEKKKKKVSI